MDILWVENHGRFSRSAVREFLASHTVTVVPGLAAARRVLSARRFAVVLVDYDLDDGKGSELIAGIKGGCDPPPVIAASSHAEGNGRLVRAGADAVCAKTEFAGIEGVVRRLCGPGAP